MKSSNEKLLHANFSRCEGFCTGFQRAELPTNLILYCKTCSRWESSVLSATLSAGLYKSILDENKNTSNC